ncbi:MAG: DUF929 family protein [Streptosporangiaceae bacterium]
MGKASRTKVDVSRREKIAAQRAAVRRSEQRRRILIASGSVLVVLVVVVVFVVVKLNSKSGTDTSSNGPTGSALASVVKTVTSVPASTLNAVGAGSGIIATPESVKGAALTANGKPEMLYIGAEYCPYCAAERWGMIVALSRFGTFTGLSTLHSAAANGAGEAEPYPNTPTWTFAKATYTSQYLTFTPVETYTNIPDSANKGYTVLDTPTSAQQALLAKYDIPPLVPASDAGAIPFVDFGNKYAIGGAGYLPSTLANLSWATIAADLSNASSSVAQQVDGTANYITAAICGITGNAPASVCNSTIQALETKIGSLAG